MCYMANWIFNTQRTAAEQSLCIYPFEDWRAIVVRRKMLAGVISMCWILPFSSSFCVQAVTGKNQYALTVCRAPYTTVYFHWSNNSAGAVESSYASPKRVSTLQRGKNRYTWINSRATCRCHTGTLKYWITLLTSGTTYSSVSSNLNFIRACRVQHECLFLSMLVFLVPIMTYFPTGTY